MVIIYVKLLFGIIELDTIYELSFKMLNFF